ncbi:hypothetical protein B0H14DRAFT_3490562 [Mycena olivaceomarginata]|nr:hypothetical protein B0H14DRAFT_3490562 [Mycena olivaceomarginata]
MVPPAFRQRNAQQDPTALESANVESSSAGAPTPSRPPTGCSSSGHVIHPDLVALDSRAADPRAWAVHDTAPPACVQPVDVLETPPAPDDGRPRGPRADHTAGQGGDSAGHGYVEERERRMGRRPRRRRTRISSSVGDASGAFGAIPAGPQRVPLSVGVLHSSRALASTRQRWSDTGLVCLRSRSSSGSCIFFIALLSGGTDTGAAEKSVLPQAVGVGKETRDDLYAPAIGASDGGRGGDAPVNS